MVAEENQTNGMVDKEIIDHYWQLAMQRKSLVALEKDHLEYEFYLNEDDYRKFPTLRGSVYLVVWQENGKIKCELR